MKNLVIILALALPLQFQAQGYPVYDNINFLSLGKQLVESAQQTLTMLDQLGKMKEQWDRIQKISNSITQLRTVERLISKNGELVNIIQNDITALANSPHIRADEAESLFNNYTQVNEIMKENIEFVKMVLKPDFWKMDDFQRMEFLKERERSIDAALAQVKIDSKWIDDIVSLREFQQMVNQNGRGH